MSLSERRPDPDALLSLTGKEGRGKLRVFLGAAPGVGKTYAMLARARAARVEGQDIVVGLVETHGRMETEALARGTRNSAEAKNRLSRTHYRGIRYRRRPGAQARPHRRRRTRPHQCARQPPPEALAGCRRTSRRGRRRLDRAQHPASGKSRGRRLAHHGRRRSRDGA